MDFNPRAFDPGRGEFCATTKHGAALPFPPAKREPPNGVRRPRKTESDSLPVNERPRVKAWKKRQGR